MPFPLRWLFASEPGILSKALEVVTRAISTYLVKKAGFAHKTAKTGAVTLIQRFGSALNLNIHFHMLFLDGVYAVDSEGMPGKFHVIETPTSCEMQKLLHRISERMARLLERKKAFQKASTLECGARFFSHKDGEPKPGKGRVVLWGNGKKVTWSNGFGHPS